MIIHIYIYIYIFFFVRFVATAFHCKTKCNMHSIAKVKSVFVRYCSMLAEERDFCVLPSPVPRSPGVQWGITTCDECGFCARVLCHNLRKGGITFWSKAMESCRFCSLCICGTVCSTKGKQCGTFLGPFKKSHMKSHMKPYEGMKHV